MLQLFEREITGTLILSFNYFHNARATSFKYVSRQGGTSQGL